MRRTPTPSPLVYGWIVWTAVVGTGFVGLLRYKFEPGTTGAVPDHWPPASRIRRTRDRSNLLLLAHPRCSCTRASLTELARIAARTQGRVAINVAFFTPPEGGREWSDTESHRTAAAIPGVRVFDDPGGAEAVRFGARTSGHTLLYDPDGRLLFSGGITRARGHEGDNAGRDALLQLLGGRPAAHAATPVFGCPILRGESKPANAGSRRFVAPSSGTLIATRAEDRS